MGKSLIIKGADFSENGFAPEFVALNWVSSANASQHFDTGLVRTGYMRIEVEFSLTEALIDNANVGNMCGLIGVCASTEMNDYLNIFWYPYSTSDKRLYGSTKSNVAGAYGGVWADTRRHSARLDSAQFAMDGVVITTWDSPITTDGQYNIWVMGINDFIVPSRKYCYAHIHRARIYSDYRSNDSLIMDLIPVKRLEDDKVCMFDLVNRNYILTSDGNNPNYGV